MLTSPLAKSFITMQKSYSSSYVCRRRTRNSYTTHWCHPFRQPHAQRKRPVIGEDRSARSLLRCAPRAIPIKLHLLLLLNATVPLPTSTQGPSPEPPPETTAAAERRLSVSLHTNSTATVLELRAAPAFCSSSHGTTTRLFRLSLSPAPDPSLSPATEPCPAPAPTPAMALNHVLAPVRPQDHRGIISTTYWRQRTRKTRRKAALSSSSTLGPVRNNLWNRAGTSFCSLSARSSRRCLCVRPCRSSAPIFTSFPHAYMSCCRCRWQQHHYQPHHHHRLHHNSNK